MIKKTICMVGISVSLASCEEPAYPLKFTVKVTDEEHIPLRDVVASSGTFLYWDRSGDGFGKDVWSKEKATTDSSGLAHFAFTSKRGDIGVNVFPPPEGYYPSTIPNFQFEKVENGRWVPENPMLEYVLKQKRNPIPLFAKVFPLGRTLHLPVSGAPCGYDFVAGDWVAPHGKGKIPDLIFTLKRRYVDVHDYDGFLTVSFGNEKDGYVEAPRPLKYGSELRLDYLAPIEGYKSLIKKFTSCDPEKPSRTSDINEEQNYYLRLRTVTDGEGNLVSANYGKIYGDFSFGLIGIETATLSFQYYFNPVANDRNLEFDPKKNLFPDQRVVEP